MAATATMSSSGPRYAPEDPTLPKPWRGLVDGKTGYLYFWNPETNVTQYERPTGASSSAHISSSVQVRQPSPGQQRGYNPDKEDDRYGRGNNGGSRGIQSAVGGAVGSQNAPKGTVGFGHGAPSVKEQGHLSTGSSLSADAYRRLHEITVSGADVPPALTSFEATGFPPEILREVRYLLLGGANVVRNAVLFWGLALIWGTFRRWTNYLEGLSKSLMFVAGTADGDNSVCYLVQTEEVVSSCSSLHQQALVAACRG